MSATIERISTYAQARKLTINKLERELNLVNGRIRKPLKDKGDVQCEVIERFAVKYPEVNLRWLLTGEGEMLNIEKISSITLIHSQNGQNSTNSVQMNNDTTKENQGEIEALKREIEALKKKVEEKDTAILNLSNAVARLSR